MNPTHKILIIDDDARNIFALSAVLKSKGYHCISAPGAAEGIRLMESDGDINIVLLDMMMPDMDGYEALSAIRGHKTISRMPVVAVTAQAMVGDKERCLQAGADAYISKPVNVDLLLNILKNHLKP